MMLKVRWSALFCAFTLLLCELLTRPFAEMAIVDDWSYVRTAQLLEKTGHIHYNGWAAPMLGWQLYFAALFFKLFGVSFTSARMTTLLVSLALAYLLQRIFVRSGINERNATIATLAVVLSSTYMTLSVVFMTDIQGLFAIAVCFYGCLRALAAATSRSATAWVVFAAVSNALLGTSRQIAWLGVLVLVPSTLWLLRKDRRVLVVGGVAMLCGMALVVYFMHWTHQQPYFVPEEFTLKPRNYTPGKAFILMPRAVMDLFYLLLPLLLPFIPQIRRSSRRVRLVYAAIVFGYLAVGIARIKAHGPNSLTEPMILGGLHPIAVPTALRVLLTAATVAGLFGLVSALIDQRGTKAHKTASRAQPSWRQLLFLLTPFLIAYFILLIPRASDVLYGRYLLAPTLAGAVLLTRYFQDRLDFRLPSLSVACVVLFAVIGMADNHDLFAQYRTRVAAIAELHSLGIPDTDIDGGWEFNGWNYLQHNDAVNEVRVIHPANSYVIVHIKPDQECHPGWRESVLNFEPAYGLRLDPQECHGAVSTTPVTYQQWMPPRKVTMYAVNYKSSNKSLPK